MAKTQSKTVTPAPAKKKTSPSNNTTKSNGSGDNSNESSLFEEFLVDELKDIYWAEKQLLKSLPKLGKAATSEELKNAFADHTEVTKGHITRLEEAFGIMGKKVQAKKCDAMAGITEEAQGVIEDTEAGTMTRDVALIIAAQKAEHYEIATYGGLKQLAKTIGKTDLSDLFDKTLSEEKEADELLTNIAETKINIEATKE